MQCRVCGAQGEHPQFDAREMMYGLDDVHRYFQCIDCQCLQIACIPDDLGRYYGKDYYSFKAAPDQGLRRRVIALRNRFAVLQTGWAGRQLCRWQPTRQFDFLGPARRGLTLDSAILDVGCGAGGLVRTLRMAGFSRARGVDPFVDGDVIFEDRTLVTRATLDQIDGSYDLVMFHHSLEHMPDQRLALEQARQRLRPGGYCIVRVPLSSSTAWASYGVHWVQLDAPRHLYLHSVDSMRRVAEQAGFACGDVAFDSTAFQFWGSEQYQQGISLRSERSYAVNPQASLFSAADIRRFDQQAEALNAQRLGDQAAFVLQR